ncbi:DUF2326 domain-containing protein [Mucilaginibacter jinjuensis]|uniref:DUF2326 domain-containing protein n=1 Tax=Mucilaginibacter jinjuensis TaxID=1176721 RepID=A0ABY7TAT9_9SPHI|nr:DUF2326 domain-containing protein [Mucilaginibacter jinjuensis]WCT12337.1 DUF2326 domain-containing protein [Mucilaginibacter jinjuensis]
MRLIKLKANNSGFKEIIFNPKGISLIVGKRHNHDYTQNRKITYNSVGKSLTIALIHFCLGSQKNPEFESKLKEWEFSLEFNIDGDNFIVSRKCNNQNIVFLNEKEYSLDDYKTFLLTKLFTLPNDHKFLSFRSLISRFIRPQKSSYTTYYDFIKDEQDFNELINNSLLLGLNTEIILKKYQLKDEYDGVEKMRKAIEDDPIMQSFFDSEDDSFEIDIVDLKQKIRKLEKSLAEFRVAEDYYQVVKEADEIKVQLRTYENRAANLKTAISNINGSLDITPDIPKKKVLELYREAEVNLPDFILRRLEEVESFNKKILDNRTVRLLKEKSNFEQKLTEVEGIIKVLGRQKDQKLEYLNTRGALDEFTKLNEQVNAFKIRLDNIEKYKKLKQEYKNKTEEIKQGFSEQNILTSNYIANNTALIEKNIILFKGFAEEFYENKRAGIEIKNNEGINKTRFDIKAKIDDDKGDGVNDVKIFCFDWTILKAQHNHKIKFIFHDSRLLSEIDSRQVATLFRVAHQNSNDSNFQYIVSANENTLDALKLELGEEDYNLIIEENIVLELTDESNESKLLGMQMDLDYDKE